MAHWHDYKHGRQHSVVGNLLIRRDVHSPELNNARDILVWLPYSYDGERRYPVLYMHDGYNLFDAFTSFSGEWGVDETMTALAEEGLEAIVVGIPNNEHRLQEYSPFPDPRFKMKSSAGEAYLRFITETLKPMIDSDFKTQPEPWATGIAGSSMGGLISLYGLLTAPHVFGYCAAFSPSFWFGQGALYETLSHLTRPTGRLYLDVGAREGRHGRNYMKGVRRIAEMLRERGYNDANFRYVEDEQGEHNEASWARRLPAALRFILPRVPQQA
ncbi:alpha/beta hydrolase-fold protein [Aggregatilineales bacterium SYSU G02658]